MFITANYEPYQVFYVEIYAVVQHVKWYHNGLKRCAYSVDTVSFSDERCPSYPVHIGPFPCAACLRTAQNGIGHAISCYRIFDLCHILMTTASAII